MWNYCWLWKSSRYHSLIISREVLVLTLPILPALQGCISWYIPQYGLVMREWPYTASSRDVLGCTSPPTSRFPSALEMSLGLRPRDISRASENLLVVGYVQPNISLLSPVYGYNKLWFQTILMQNCAGAKFSCHQIVRCQIVLCVRLFVFVNWL